MAFCPKCKGEMGTTETVCPHCGYQSPSLDEYQPREKTNREGLAYSQLADIALTVGMLVTAFGAVGAVIAGVISIVHADLLAGLDYAPLSCLWFIALFVVFQRVKDLN